MYDRIFNTIAFITAWSVVLGLIAIVAWPLAYAFVWALIRLPSPI